MSMTPVLSVELTSMDAYLSLFGANGRNLPMIENELNVELTVRGSDLLIGGEEALVAEKSSKALSIAVEELNQGKIKILTDEEEA